MFVFPESSSKNPKCYWSGCSTKGPVGRVRVYDHTKYPLNVYTCELHAIAWFHMEGNYPDFDDNGNVKRQWVDGKFTWMYRFGMSCGTNQDRIFDEVFTIRPTLLHSVLGVSWKEGFQGAIRDQWFGGIPQRNEIYGPLNYIAPEDPRYPDFEKDAELKKELRCNTSLYEKMHYYLWLALTQIFSYHYD